MIDISNPRDLGFLPDRLDRIPALLKAKYLDTGCFPHAALLIPGQPAVPCMSCAAHWATTSTVGSRTSGFFVPNKDHPKNVGISLGIGTNFKQSLG